MAREVEKVNAVKRLYLISKEQGNHCEEARWVNVIGDILKNRGEYVEALKWMRLNYDVTYYYLHDKQLLPTCQSLGGSIFISKTS